MVVKAVFPWPQWGQVRIISRGLQTQRPVVDGDVLVSVTEVLLGGRACQLEYQARNWPEPLTIVAHPLGLIFREPNISLIGLIEGREGVRQMVLHRISGCTVTEEPV